MHFQHRCCLFCATGRASRPRIALVGWRPADTGRPGVQFRDRMMQCCFMPRGMICPARIAASARIPPSFASVPLSMDALPNEQFAQFPSRARACKGAEWGRSIASWRAQRDEDGAWEGSGLSKSTKTAGFWIARTCGRAPFVVVGGKPCFQGFDAQGFGRSALLHAPRAHNRRDASI